MTMRNGGLFRDAIGIAKKVARNALEEGQAMWRRFRAVTSIAAFQEAVRERNLRVIAGCVEAFADVGYTPADAWVWAQQGDPRLNQTVYDILLNEALRVHGRDASPVASDNVEEAMEQTPKREDQVQD